MIRIIELNKAKYNESHGHKNSHPSARTQQFTALND
jgi:hypothetical protein